MNLEKGTLKGLASTLGVTTQQLDTSWWAILRGFEWENQLEHNVLENSLNKFKNSFQTTIDELQGKYIVLVDNNGIVGYFTLKQNLIKAQVCSGKSNTFK